MMRALSVTLMVAMAIFGIAPVAVCDMPPECLMWQVQAQEHDCCAEAATDSLAQAPCHPMTTSAVSSTTSRLVQPVQSLDTLSVMLQVVASSSILTPTAVIPAAVPRFLLTHTFRL